MTTLFIGASISVQCGEDNKTVFGFLAHGPFYTANLVHLVFEYWSIIEIMLSHRIRNRCGCHESVCYVYSVYIAYIATDFLFELEKSRKNNVN